MFEYDDILLVISFFVKPILTVRLNLLADVMVFCLLSSKSVRCVVSCVLLSIGYLFSL